MALVSEARCTTPRVISDFACGGGSLLSAAARTWPAARLVGIDVDRHALAGAQATVPRARFGRLDFLKPRARSRSALLQAIQNRVDLVLLNPPFSDRSQPRHAIVVEGEKILVPRSIAFVLEAMKYLRPDGELLAILPITAAFGDNCHRWARIFRPALSVIRKVPPQFADFRGVEVETVFIRITPADLRDANVDPWRITSDQPTAIGGRLTVVRGNVPAATGVDVRPPAASRFVHSIHLQNNRLKGLSYARVNDVATVEGPMILLPRVGRPNVAKVALLVADEPLVLSDCVMAIRSGWVSDLRPIFNLLQNESVLRSLYTGTCAKFTTLSRVLDWLQRSYGTKSEPVHGVAAD